MQRETRKLVLRCVVGWLPHTYSILGSSVDFLKKCDVHNLNDQVKEDEMDRSFFKHEKKKRNTYRILVGKPEENRPLGRPRCRWEYNIKMDLRNF
jgi:hypothetical protein